jgi:hypothetical protein
VLVSNRGGLGEVAGVYPGSAPVEPTVAAIVEAVAAWSEPARWSELVAEVRPIEGMGPTEWAEKHAALYGSMTR